MNQNIVIFGEVLFDIFPDHSRVLGGAPFNVAWHLQAFGLNPCFISRVGNDELGDEIKQAMQSWGMTIAQLQTDNQYPTGTVQISFEHDEPHYDIVANQAYDFIDAQSLNNTDSAVLYHGSLALRNEVSAQALETLKHQHQGKVFVDVNLRAPWWSAKQIVELLKQADWVKLNDQEFKVLYAGTGDLKADMPNFLKRYGLDVLVVTRGELGAVALNQQGEWVEVTPTEQLEVVDTVGAGDAFAAMLLRGLQQGWSLQKTLNQAQAFASRLVTKRGAIVRDKTFYDIN